MCGVRVSWAIEALVVFSNTCSRPHKLRAVQYCQARIGLSLTARHILSTCASWLWHDVDLWSRDPCASSVSDCNACVNWWDRGREALLIAVLLFVVHMLQR